jgi:ribokinase
MSSSRARICVLGSINMDLVGRSPRLPAPGETVLGGAFERHPGGKGANQAAAAARMGAEVRMIGLVGDDEHGRAMREALGAAGVDVSAVAAVDGSAGAAAGAATGVALITVDERGENTIVVASGANALLTAERVDAAAGAIRDADVLLMQLESPVEAVVRAAGIAREAGVAVILNAAPAPQEALPDDLIAAVDILIVNEGEARAIARTNQAVSFAPTRPPDQDDPGGGGGGGARALHPALAPLVDLGPGGLVVTLGVDGAAFSWERDAGSAPAFAVEAVDTVGAGDAFCGAFACRWGELRASGQFLDRMSMVDALSWACAAGALATTKAGAMPSLPTRGETLALLKSV